MTNVLIISSIMIHGIAFNNKIFSRLTHVCTKNYTDLLEDAIMPSKTNPCSGRQKKKRGNGDRQK